MPRLETIYGEIILGQDDYSCEGYRYISTKSEDEPCNTKCPQDYHRRQIYKK